MNDVISTLISAYGLQIIGAAITAIAGALGFMFKNLATKFLNDKTKQQVAKTVVQGIEQVYKTLDGPSKLQKAIETAQQMLQEKGITVTELEIKMLLESAVGEFNEVFKKEKTNEKSDSWVNEEVKSNDSVDNIE